MVPRSDFRLHFAFDLFGGTSLLPCHVLLFHFRKCFSLVELLIQRGVGRERE